MMQQKTATQGLPESLQDERIKFSVSLAQGSYQTRAWRHMRYNFGLCPLCAHRG